MTSHLPFGPSAVSSIANLAPDLSKFRLIMAPAEAVTGWEEPGDTLAYVPFRNLVSRHARREAARERITLDDIEATHVWADATRPSTHDAERGIRTRYSVTGAIEVVVDRIPGRVVTVWRKGAQP